MIHGDEFGTPDWILMILAPPLAGAALGLIVGIWRRRPSIAAICGAAGGAAGAWIGIAIYRWVMNEVIGGRDNGVFAAITLGSFFLAAIPLAWAMSGARVNSDGVPRVNTTGCAFVSACSVVAAFGVFLYLIASEPSAQFPMGNDVKYLGIACILSGTITLAIGLATTRRNS